MKRSRRDADDREAVAVQVDDPAEDGRIAAETPPPEVFADDEHGIAAGLLVLVREKGAAEDGLDSQQCKEVCRDDLGLDPLRLVVDGEAGGRGHRRLGAGKNLVVLAEIPQIGQGGAAAALVGHQHDEAVLVGHTRQRVQHEAP